MKFSKIFNYLVSQCSSLNNYKIVDFYTQVDEMPEIEIMRLNDVNKELNSV